jgi:hypothetical protein
MSSVLPIWTFKIFCLEQHISAPAEDKAGEIN